jgi:hypothetical protein
MDRTTRIASLPWLVAFHFADLLVTFVGVYGMGFQEGNPIAAKLIPYPFWLVMFKVAGIAFLVWWAKAFDSTYLRVVYWLNVSIVAFVVVTWILVICGYVV